MQSRLWMPSGQPTLVCERVSVRYGDALALDDVSFVAEAGQIIGVVGPNGAGKTTLFKAIVGLLPLAQGRILVDREPLPKGRSRVVYVPQREAVDWSFPVSVLDVVLMGVTARRGWLRRIDASDRREAVDALEQVGMLALLKAPIGEVSGGQQQRVFLARAICQGGDVLALDEPFSGVDIAASHAIEQILRQLAQRGRLILLSTHDLGQAAQLGDRILLLNRQPVAFGLPHEALRPDRLREAYGDRVFVVGEQRIAVSDHH
ncbi:MAG: metal ABC transporter ATP-binding protein [Chloroflexi bacterium]|nr:metal ABC transporter ATP-binding protein [Chloroflexota bacterium]